MTRLPESMPHVGNEPWPVDWSVYAVVLVLFALPLTGLAISLLKPIFRKKWAER